MLKKENEVRRLEYAKKSFNIVKFSLTCAPTLINLDYILDFIIFLFDSKHSLVAVLMQKKDSKTEQPISFFSRTIRDAVLRYNIIQKKGLVLGKALKEFRVYILHSHIIAYVLNAMVKYVLMQTDL